MAPPSQGGSESLKKDLLIDQVQRFSQTRRMRSCDSVAPSWDIHDVAGCGEWLDEKAAKERLDFEV